MKPTILLLFGLFTINIGSSQECISEFIFNPKWTPLGLATDGNHFWVSEYYNGFSSSEINIYDNSGNYIETLLEEQGVENFISCIEIVEDTLWLVKEEKAELLKMNKTSGELYQTFDLPTFSQLGANSSGITYDGTYLWNTEHTGFNALTRLFKINPVNGIVLDTISLNLSFILPIEFINGKMFGISINDGSLNAIDIETGETNYILEWCLKYPFDLCYNIEGNELYGVSSFDDLDELGSVHKITGLDILTGINAVEPDEDILIEIYPNPTRDILRINSSVINKAEILIVNSVGKICFTDQLVNHKMAINISDFPAGVYYLYTEFDGKRLVDKFTKI